MKTLKWAALARRNEKGFSLVELIIVIAIIGILVAIAIPVYGNIQNDAREKAVQSDMANAATALQAYEAREGAYPLTLAEIRSAALVASKESYVDGGSNFLYCSNGEDYGIWAYTNKNGTKNFWRSSVRGGGVGGVRGSASLACDDLGVTSENRTVRWLKLSSVWMI